MVSGVGRGMGVLDGVVIVKGEDRFGRFKDIDSKTQWHTFLAHPVQTDGRTPDRCFAAFLYERGQRNKLCKTWKLIHDLLFLPISTI